MKTWICACGLVALAAATVAKADDRCDGIRTAQAIGLVTDDPIAVARLATTKSQVPVVEYETVAAEEGDTLENIAKLNEAFAPEYSTMLVKALNPYLSGKELHKGEAVRIPKAIPPLEDVWKVSGSNQKTPWAELSESLELGAKAKRVTEETHDMLAELNVEPNDSGEQIRVTGSVDEMYRTGYSSQSDLDDFRKLDAQVTSLQGTSYVRDLIYLYKSKSDSMSLKDIALTAAAAAEQTAAVNSGRVQIVVLTKSLTNKPVEGLRVYRATPISAEANCMQETKIEFDTRSYEASDLIPIARWIVWAEDTNRHKSKPRIIDVVDQSDNGRQFDLTIDWVR